MSMPKIIKACKIHCKDCLEGAVLAGFTHLGIHAIHSVSPSSLEHAKHMKSVMSKMSERGFHADLVLVTKVNDPDALLNALKETAYDWLQLHSHWEISDLKKLKKKISEDQELKDKSIKIITLLDPSKNSGEPEQDLVSLADYIIVDHERGGTGQRVPTSLLEASIRNLPKEKIIIAGGLNSGNVREIIERFSPAGVDVQTGIARKEIQDSRLMRDFVLSAKGPDVQRPVPGPLPFSQNSQPFWRNLDPDTVTREGLVAKFNLIEALEQSSAYLGSDNLPYTLRIQNSLNQLANLGKEIDPAWLEAALVMFANVVYLPSDMLRSAWKSLFLRLSDQLSDENLFQAIQLLENDPKGMIDEFCHVNSLEGRLDSDKMARIEGVSSLASILIAMKCPETRNLDFQTLKLIIEKPNWVLLVDKTLSGNSLETDLSRIVFLANILKAAGRLTPRIIILAQVATKRAEDSVHRVASSYDGEMHFMCAIRFGEHDTVQHQPSGLIQSPQVAQAARDLCVWFAGRFLSKDPAWDRMRKRSEDFLEFGYRGAGLLYSDFENCPTGSVPLLWYRSADYTGPFPRVHSRIGNQSFEVTAAKWNFIMNIEPAEWIKILKEAKVI